MTAQSTRRTQWLTILAIVVTCILFYWKLTISSEYVWFDHPDMCYIELPRLNFEAREIHHGRFPLWDPGIWMGQPLLGQTQPGPVFPLNLLFFLLPLREGNIDFRWLNWYYVIAHAIAAISMYALCRDLRRSHAASAIAAFAIAFGGFIGTVAWLDVFNGAIWTPAICLFFLRAARGIRPLANAAICALFLGIAWLSGHHELPLLVSYALAAGWAWTIYRKRTRESTVSAITTFVLAGLIAAVQLWPTAEFARLSQRWVGLEKSVAWQDAISYTVPTGYSLSVRALPGLAIDSAGSYADSSLFLGFVITSLALFAIASSWRHPLVRWMAVLTAVSAAYCLGAATPLQGLLYNLAPMLGKARIPVRGIHLLNFSLVMLAAAGFDALVSRHSSTWSSRLVKIAAATGALILAASLFRSDVSDGFVLAGLVALLLAACTLAWMKSRFSRTLFSASLLCLMLVELYPVGTRTFSSSFAKGGQRFVRTLTDNADIVEFLRSEPSPRRVAVNDTDIPTNFADWHGFDGYEGYVAGTTENLMALPRHERRIQNLLGITHFVSREVPGPAWEEAFIGGSGVRVFRNPEALPRVWSTHSITKINSRNDVDAVLSRDGFDPRVTALLTDYAPDLQSCTGDRLQLIARAPNRMRVHATMQCRGLLVFSETWYPGWIARIDGQETEVLEVFGALRGVVVEGGDHSVELIYRPRSVYGGAVLSAAGLALAFGIVAVDRFRRRSSLSSKP